MSSFSSSRNWRYDVFPSFSGDDVRKAFLSHLFKEFERRGIDAFEDEGIKKGQSIGPELVDAIKESKISIVVLSKNYASSSWCLDELLEIMKCKETAGQKVIAIFYELDPSDVRKQKGDFGKGFDKICVGKREEVKRRWRKALTDVANIAGVDSRKWRKEADMIERIAMDVFNKLHSTPSKDFDDLVGIEAHIAKMYSLLRLESDDVRMVGICGLPGIGKTTIARALYHRLSSNFQHSCFMDNFKERNRRTDRDSYGLKLRLQQRFLSEIFGIKGLRIHHLREVHERLKYRKVLVILDDTDELEQLQALVDQPHWFGLGSRIIVTTEKKQLLSAHSINHVYEVGLPSGDEALQIFCQHAFGKNSAPASFREHAIEAADIIAGRLPLGLSLLGLFLRRKRKKEWEDALPRFRTSGYWKIDEALRVCYDSLDEKDKAIFLHIACLFNGEKVDHVIQLLADSDLNVSCGLTTLADNCIIQIIRGRIQMHSLLQQMGREVVRKQSNEPGKRQFIVDPKEIHDVLIDKTGTGAVLGISLDMSEINEWSLTDRSFKGMYNLLFLRFYKNSYDGQVKVQLPKGLDSLPQKLRLLRWDAGAMKSMPRFNPEFLIELTMREYKLKKLWRGTQPLRSLKKLDLSWSKNLKQIPDLSEATNLEKLDLSFCERLAELPYSIRKLNKLKSLNMSGCIKLEDLPTDINLESLSSLDLNGCSELKCFPEISRNIEILSLSNTAIKEVPLSIRDWSRLACLNMFGCENLKTFPHVPDHVKYLGLARTGIEEVPSWIESLLQLRLLVMTDCKRLTSISSSISKLEHLGILDFSGNNFESIPDCFKFLSQLRELDISNCTKLISLPVLPDSLLVLFADGCESLERISQSFYNRLLRLKFGNCFKLDQEAQRLIQQSVCLYAYLPLGEVPDYFTHRAWGSSLTIHLDRRPLSAFSGFKAGVVLAMGHKYNGANDVKILCHLKRKHGEPFSQHNSPRLSVPLLQELHLIMFSSNFLRAEDNDSKVELTKIEILFEFNCTSAAGSVDWKIVGCGVQLVEAHPSPENRLDQRKIPTYVREEDAKLDQPKIQAYVREEDESRGIIEIQSIAENAEEYGSRGIIQNQFTVENCEENENREIIGNQSTVENGFFVFFILYIVIAAVLFKVMRFSLGILFCCGFVVICCCALWNGY